MWSAVAHTGQADERRWRLRWRTRQADRPRRVAVGGERDQQETQASRGRDRAWLQYHEAVALQDTDRAVG
jgi:hypothetical protein